MSVITAAAAWLSAVPYICKEDLYSAKNQLSLGAEISSHQCKEIGLKDDMQRFCGYLK